MILLHLFVTTFVVGAFTFGGGYAMIPILKGQLVDRFGWVTDKDFGAAVAVGQITPGPLTIMVAFLGWKMAGFPGAVAAAVGLYLPAFLAVLVVARFYVRIKNSPRVQGILGAFMPAIAALLVKISLDFGKELKGTGGLSYGVAAVSFLLMTFTSLSPAWVLIGSLLLGVLTGVKL